MPWNNLGDYVKTCSIFKYLFEDISMNIISPFLYWLYKLRNILNKLGIYEIDGRKPAIVC